MQFGLTHRLSKWAPGIVAVVMVCLLPVMAKAQPSADGLAVTPVSSDGTSLETRQFRLENARVPGRLSARQTVTAWQVTQGSWNGQALDGLCLVLVQATSEDGQSVAQVNCYISHEATPAQREALLAAFLTTQPQIGTAREMSLMRVEPAVITLEVYGQTVILHLGLVA